MHVLYDLAPAHAGVVRAKRDLSFLRSVRNDAHFCAAEIVGPEVLKPHAFDAEDAPVVLLSNRVFIRSLRSLSDLSELGLKRFTICEMGNPLGAQFGLEVAHD